MSSTTSQLIKERIDQLWNTILTASISESYSRYLARMIFRLAQDNEIKLQATFFQMVCPSCFSFFVPGKNCFQAFYTRKQIRKLKEKKRKAKKSNDPGNGNEDEAIKFIIYSSQLFSHEKTVEIKEKEPLFCTFKCTGCKSLIIHDNTPLEFAEFKPRAISRPTQQSSKQQPSRDNLQKILQKSQLPKKSDSDNKELDLESFLNGFI